MNRKTKLFLLLMVMSAMVSYAQIPTDLPSSDYVKMSVKPGQPGEVTTVKILIMLPDTCYAVNKWGEVVREGNRFYIDVEIVNTGAGICYTVIVEETNTYELEDIAEGAYSVTLTNYGSAIKTVSFTVKDGPEETGNPTPIPIQSPSPPPPEETGDPTPTPIQSPSPTSTGAMGDVNCDGVINVVDAFLVARYYLALEGVYDECFIEHSDVNCDGVTNIIDALIIVQYYVGLRSDLSC